MSAIFDTFYHKTGCQAPNNVVKNYILLTQDSFLQLLTDLRWKEPKRLFTEIEDLEKQKSHPEISQSKLTTVNPITLNITFLWQPAHSSAIACPHQQFPIQTVSGPAVW